MDELSNIIEVTDVLDVTENSLSLGERSWKLYGKLALSWLGVLRKRTAVSELRSSITAPDGTIWEFETRSSEEQLRNGLEIAKEAFEDLGSEDFSVDGLDEEWHDRFWDDAKRKYTQDARSTYARILAGELRHPGSVSRLTLSVLDDLDEKTAKVFQRYCTLAARFPGATALMYEPPDLDWSENGLEEFGVTYSDIGLLAEHRLVRDTSSTVEADMFFVLPEDDSDLVRFSFVISNVTYRLQAVSGKEYKRMSVVVATTAGDELARMVEPSATVDVAAYTSKLFGEMESKGARVVRADSGTRA